MAIGLGSNSYMLIGKQTARGTLRPWADFQDTIYEFSGGGIGMDADFTNVPRNKGNLGPTATTIGQLGSAGTLRLNHDATKMGIWWEALMYDDPTSTQIQSSVVSIIAATNLTNDTALNGPSESAVSTTAKQPRYRLPSITAANAGLNCAKIVIGVTTQMVVPAAGASLTIKGLDQGYRPLEEVITLTRGQGEVDSSGNIAVGDSWTLANYYSQLDSITPAGLTTAGAIKVDFDAREYYRHVFEVGNTIPNGLTIEMVKGDIPSLYRDVVVADASYTIGAQNELALTLQGGAAWPERNAENGGTTKSSITGKDRPAGLSAPGFGTIFKLDGTTIKCGEGSVSVNHSLGADENPYARDIYRPAPIQTSNREVSLSARVSYPAQDIDGNDVDVKEMISKAWGTDVSASLDCALMDYGAAHNSVLIELPTARYANFPDPADIPNGQINNTLELNGYAKGSTTDLRVTCWNGQTKAQFLG